jgi:purine-nucleoside phosphorylase
LLVKAVDQAQMMGYPCHAGMVFSSDLFSSYNALGEDSWKAWARMGALAQDMETYALYATAAWTQRRALSILTMTDSCVTGEGFGPDMRSKGLYPLMKSPCMFAGGCVMDFLEACKSVCLQGIRQPASA